MTPILLVIGFLGAGKTTLLRNLVPRLLARNLEPFVVINDYRDATIDAAGLRGESREVVTINGNCVCCDSLHELVETLAAVPPNPRQVVLIEANGTSDPYPLIEHLTLHPALGNRFAPLLQVSVVDADRWQRRAWHNELEQLQVRPASHLVLSRMAEVFSPQLAAVRADLTRLCPRAEETDAKRLAEEFAKLAVAPRKTLTAPPPSYEEHRPDLAHAFVAVEVSLPALVDGATLCAWLRALPETVLRVKGVASLREMRGKQFIFQRTDLETREPTMFPVLGESSPARAVLIGARLDATALQRDAAVALSA